MSAVQDRALPRRERLRDRREFERLFRLGARVEQASFVLVWMAAAGPRTVAFAASRRLGDSVERNRARRRLRAAYREQKVLVAATGLRLCFVARPAAGRGSFAELVAQMGVALRQAEQRRAA